MTRNDTIAQLYQDGGTLQAIGYQFGITRERVRQILVEQNITDRDFRRKQKQPFIDAAKQRIINGESKEAVVQDTGLSPSALNLTKEETRQQCINKLWRQIDVRSNDECWNWTGYVSEGRPHVSARPIQRGQSRVPVLIWLITYGKPKGWIMQTCENKLCCNPAHLKDMSPSEALTKYRKGTRASKCGKPLRVLAKEWGVSLSVAAYRIKHWPEDKWDAPKMPGVALAQR